jgi:hypothetical protein
VDFCVIIRGRLEVARGSPCYDLEATETDYDSRDPVATEALFDKYQPTHVIHLAALGELHTGSLRDSTEKIDVRQSADSSRI